MKFHYLENNFLQMTINIKKNITEKKDADDA